jgi:hypothetical protein
MGGGWAAYAALLTDHFVGHHDPACASPLFALAAAQAHAAQKPDGMTDDLGWTSVMCVGGGEVVMTGVCHTEWGSTPR